MPDTPAPAPTSRTILAWLGRNAPGLLALTFAALAAGPLLAHGGFLMTRGGGDSPFLLVRLQQLLAGLRGGQFPVRWMPDADYGYGYPFFNYYAALPYYLAASLHVYGFSYVAALKLTQCGALLAAAAGAYAWARLLGSAPDRPGLPRTQAVLAAAAYTFAPFHLVNLYVRGDSLSELWAMALYPWLLWGVQRCLARPSFGRALAVAGLAGLLAVTHNISALNFMPFAGLYALLAGWPRRAAPPAAAEARPTPAEARAPGRRRGLALAVTLLALGWGLALSAFFWLPALREVPAVQIADVTQGYFFYGNHFRGRDLVQTSLFFSPETGPGLPSPFSMGLIQSIALGMGLLAWLWRAVRRRRWSASDTFLLLGLGLSTWMVTPASAWVWQKVPLVRFTQFPWRFLSVQALFGAVLTGYLAPPETGTRARSSAAWRWAISVGVGLALALFSLGGLRPDFIPLTDAEVGPQQINLLEAFTANIGSTIGFEYLPNSVEPRPYSSELVLGRPPELKVLAGAANGTQLWKRGASERWTISADGVTARVAVPIHAWPGWSALIDGRPVPVTAVDGLGWLSFDAPAGTHVVDLRLGLTPVRAAAERLSALALLVPIGLAAYARGRARGWRLRRRPGSGARWLLGAGLVVGAAVAGALLLRLPAGRAGPSALPLSMDLFQLTYPHHAAITFTGGAELTRVVYSTDRPARGATLQVQTEWRAATAGQATLALVPASNLLDPVPWTVSAATQSVSAGTTVGVSHNLPVPTAVPPGLYFVTVSFSDGDGPRPALTPAGRTRGPVYLAPVVIDDDGPDARRATPLASFGPAIDLLSADVQALDSRNLRLNLLWRARQPVAANYEVALRLRDAAGFEWSAFDAQAGYGFYPTHVWRAGQGIPDVYGLALPAGAPPAEYELTVELYDPPTRASLGTAVVSVPLTQTTAAEGRPARYELNADLALAGVDFPAAFDQGDAPEIGAGWLTLRAPHQAYHARWTLTAAEAANSGQAPLVQVLDLAPGSPATAWPAGAYVLGRARFGTPPALAPGAYRLSVTLLDEAGAPASPDVVVREVQVRGRGRSFALPPVEVQVGATFGDVLMLHGYNAQRQASDLRLALVWQALRAPGADYKFFVHLYDPADSAIVRQVDAVPLDFTYSTALWVEGEVVTDTVALPLAGVPAGAYNLAVGWYDPHAPKLDRLPAFDAGGQRLPEDRVILPLRVQIP